MPRSVYWAVLLLSSLSLLGQDKPGTTKEAPKKPNSDPAQVAPDDFVILITGACQTPPGEFAVRDCQRGVTRQEFERLIAATQPMATPEYRQHLAESLGQVLILSNEAKKRELPKDPEVHELLHFLELQQLGNLFVTRFLKKDATPTEEQINAYFHQHYNEFETADMVRIIVPGTGKSIDADKQFAESIRSRCALGQDAKMLQAEADQHVGRPASQPVDLLNQRRAMYPAAQQSIFDMQKGECQAMPQNKGDFFVYKMVTKSEAPNAEARATITTLLESSMVHQRIEELTKKNVIDLNSKYFSHVQPKPPQPSEQLKK